MVSDKVERKPVSSSERMCFICEEKPAQFQVKGRPQDCYCEDCAVENFGSVEYLEQIQ